MSKRGRPKGSRAELEANRIKGAKMLAEGLPPSEVARQLGVTKSAVSHWRRDMRDRGGVKGLKSKGKPGPQAKMTPQVIEKARRALIKGPRANGLDADLWTLESAGAVVARICGHTFSHQRIWLLLRRDLKWSPQRPAMRATQRDEDAIEKWRKREWPRIKKKRRNAEPS
jgi:transposase